MTARTTKASSLLGVSGEELGTMATFFIAMRLRIVALLVAGNRVGMHTLRMVESSLYAVFPILIASMLGSPHCAGMCGGFVALYSHTASHHTRSHILYSLGRLTTYLVLGVGAALLGHTLDNAFGIARISSAIVGVVLVIIGVSKVLGIVPSQLSTVALPLTSALKAMTRPILEMRSAMKPFFIGLITTLLPCGWLYSFVGLALASAQWSDAVVIMTVFWLGTLPVMLSLGFISRFVTTQLGGLFPRLVGILLVLGGVMSFSLHLQHADHTGHAHHSSDAHHHD